MIFLNFRIKRDQIKRCINAQRRNQLHRSYINQLSDHERILYERSISFSGSRSQVVSPIHVENPIPREEQDHEYDDDDL